MLSIGITKTETGEYSLNINDGDGERSVDFEAALARLTDLGVDPRDALSAINTADEFGSATAQTA